MLALHYDETVGELIEVWKHADFGEAHGVLDDGSTKKGKGTKNYAAKETVDPGVYDEKSDLYSYGRIVYEMLTGVLPPDHEVDPFVEVNKEKWFDEPIFQHPVFGKDLAALLKKMLATDVDARPNISDAMEELRRIQQLIEQDSA